MLAVTKEVVEAARENLVIRQCCENSTPFCASRSMFS